MEKATEAREKNEQGAELEQIKLCVVNSVASGLDGLVDTTSLKSELNGLVEEQGRLAIDDSKSSWEVIGKESKIKYEINKNGTVIVKSGITLSTTKIEFTEELTECTLEATLSPDLKGTINWSIPENNGVASISEIEGNEITITKVGESGSTTITATLNGISYPTTCDVEIVVPLQVGDSIDFGVDLLENETADWVILYDGTNDDETENSILSGKIFATLKDYLPNDIRESLGIATDLNTNNTMYNVFFSTNTYNGSNKLIGKLTSEDWKYLVKTEIITKQTIGGDTVQVVGALDKDTVDAIKNSKTPKAYYLPSSKSDYNTHKCEGYWVSSSVNALYLYAIYHNGGTNTFAYYENKFGICPVVIMPSDIPLKKANGIWQIDTTQMVNID